MISKRTKNMSGEIFERLKVIDFAYNKGSGGHSYWNCLCSCGNKTIVRGSHLRCGNVKSCGCLAIDVSRDLLKKYAKSDAHKGSGNPQYKHGESDNPLYKIYIGIRGRCNVKSSGNYKNYGERGIKVEWKSYKDFKRDMGNKYIKHIEKYGKNNTSIDRIDVNGNYSKENCRWATNSQQQRNKRNSKKNI